MAFRSIRQLGDAHVDGRMISSHFRKVPSQTSSAGMWVDLSMAAGNPPANYYASSPLVAATLDPFRGLFHGADAPTGEKLVTEISLTTPTAGLVGPYYLLDYLLYYPFVALDDADPQTMDNTVELDRYTDGDGVMILPVCVAPTVGGGTFTVEYVNQDGVTQTTPTQNLATAAINIASVPLPQPSAAGSRGPFLTLASGDTGVRRINSVQMGTLDGGLMSLVLVRPLGSGVIREVSTESCLALAEQRWQIPTVLNGAFLALIMQCAATVSAGTLSGRMDLVWNDE